MPLIPLRGMTILPDTVIHFDLNREKSVKALEYAMMKKGELFLVAQTDATIDMPGEENLYRVGTIAMVKQITKLPNQIVRVLVEGKRRGLLKGVNEENTKFIEAYVEDICTQEAEAGESAVEAEAMLRQLKEYFSLFAMHYPKLDKNAVQRYSYIKDPGSLMDQIAMNLPVSYEKRQKVLDAIS